MDVAYHPAAREELAGLPRGERLAMLHAAEKLQTLGEQLPFPHCSALRQARQWELRPRGGRSPWRAFYRRVGGAMVIGAIGPDAKQEAAGFRRAVVVAERRIEEIEAEQGGR
ncbi:MAG: hypothetical protein EPO21_07055 [Chloroflexota bacterium]|nr:MAG: hypothetical protein EPO21_07055 [Chloroflexota bacterium]